MPRRPQQATTRNRRVVTVAQPPDYNNVTWTLEITTDHELRINMTQVVAQWVIIAPPSLKMGGVPLTLSITGVSGDQIICNAVETLDGSAIYSLAPLDPGVRTNTGGYLAGQLWQGSSIISVDLTVALFDSVTIDLTPAGTVSEWRYAKTEDNSWFDGQIITHPNGNVPTSVETRNDGVIRLSYLFDQSGEDGIEVVGSGKPLVRINGEYIAAGVYLFP